MNLQNFGEFWRRITINRTQPETAYGGQSDKISFDFLNLHMYSEIKPPNLEEGEGINFFVLDSIGRMLTDVSTSKRVYRTKIKKVKKVPLTHRMVFLWKEGGSSHGKSLL